MCRALIIGAGGVGTVVTQKIAANPIFTDVMLASRTKSKCDAVLPDPKSLGANYTGQTSIPSWQNRVSRACLGTSCSM